MSKQIYSLNRSIHCCLGWPNAGFGAALVVLFTQANCTQFTSYGPTNTAPHVPNDKAVSAKRAWSF